MQKIALNEIVSRLASSRQVVILHHVHPDGDTLGSGFALKLMLEKMGKTVSCLCDEEPSETLRFLLAGQTSLKLPFPEEADLVFSIDVASEKQLGKLGYLASRCAFMIDHHGAGTPFAPCYLNSSAAAAAELVYEIYAFMRNEAMLPEMPEVCRRLYAAIMDDTGNLKYSNVTSNTLKISSELLQVINREEKGWSASEISRRLFDARPLNAVLADAFTAGKIRCYANGRLTVAVVMQEEMTAKGLAEVDFADSVDVIRRIAGVEVGVLLKQQAENPGTFRVSSRSNGAADVAAVCAQFGGGGHTKAAGCTISAANEEEAYCLAESAFGKAL